MAAKSGLVETVAAPVGTGFESPLISHARLQRMYVMMLKCRMLEESKFGGGYEAAIGHEASLVAMAMEVAAGDTVAAADSDYIFKFVGGAKLKPVVKAMGAATGGRSFTAKLKKATQVAMSHKRKKKNVPVSLVYADDAAATGPLWLETLKLAGEKELPMVLVRQSDFFEKKDAAPVMTGGRVHGMPLMTVDGNDAVAVYRVAQEAMHRARTGHGATVVECRTYRWHTKSKRSEKAFWKTKDPIPRMQKFLEAKGLYSEAWAKSVRAEFEIELGLV